MRQNATRSIAASLVLVVAAALAVFTAAGGTAAAFPVQIEHKFGVTVIPGGKAGGHRRLQRAGSRAGPGRKARRGAGVVQRLPVRRGLAQDALVTPLPRCW